MLPWSFSEEAAAEKHMAQLQHNMWVTNARSAALSIITGGGKWIEMTIPSRRALPAFSYHRRASILALRPNRRDAEALWDRTAAASGRSGSRGRYERVEFWAEFAGLFCATRSAFLDHERAKAELKALMPEDAKEATGHGVRAKRSKSGAVSFDLLATEENHAAF